MGALHKKTEKLEGVKFFTGNYSKKKEKEKEEQAMTVKDYERLLITDRGGELDEEEEGMCPVEFNVVQIVYFVVICVQFIQQVWKLSQYASDTVHIPWLS